jgi:NAD+ synthase
MAREMKIPLAILEKAPSAGLWEGQSDEGEIGLSYADIDTALKNLEANNWKAVTQSEEQVLARVQKNSHKRIAASSLLKAR